MVVADQRKFDRKCHDRSRLLVPAPELAYGISIIAMAAALTAAPVSIESLGASQAEAQQVPSVTSPFDQIAAEDPDARMLLEADELIYDLDNDIVAASGTVDIYYRGYTIEAERVDYNQKTGQVFARGGVKVVQPDGNVIYAETVELTDQFREGFVQELTLVTTDETRFAAQSAERFDDNVTVFNAGVYTACKPCEENPEKPPFWQIKAKRIIHNQEEKTVYYEDATFELFGMPIAYLPFLSHPDPTVKQQSGFLRPAFVYDKDLGYGVEIPYYFALAPDYDLTVSATTYSLQGPLGEFQWRQRLASGSYMIRGAGIYQLNPQEFEPTSDNNREERGAIQTEGLFEINEFWKWGWTGTLQSDDIFLRTYDLTSATEVRDTLFLNGQSARNWFDGKILHYQVLKESGDNQNSLQAFLHPIVDYNYIFDDPVMGGRLSYDSNFMSRTRDDAEFLPLFPFARANDPDFGCPYRSLNDIDSFIDRTPGSRERIFSRVSPDTCELIGAPGTTTRFINEVNWDRTLTDGIGQQFTPFAGLRGDLYAIDVEDTYVEAGYSTTPIIDQFIPEGNNNVVRGMATAGLEYRYPILVSDSWGYQIVEPMAQIIARPDATGNDEVTNDDALSLVFDDTNLFQVDKFSGYDLLEGGTRANVGLRYNLKTNTGLGVAGVFGQSYQLAGENPFPIGSGLETDRSDYVGALYFNPLPSVQIANRMRLDEDDFALQRYDLELNGRYGIASSSIIYSNIAADPQQGIDEDRQEIQGRARLRLNENWSVWGAGRYEISGVSRSTIDNPQSPQWISNSFGFGYHNECISLSVDYRRTYARDEDTIPDERITFRFSLRTLVDGQYRHDVNPGDDDE